MEHQTRYASAKNVLAVDTSTATASFAIAQNGHLLASLVSTDATPHSQTFFGLLQKLLAEAGLRLPQIDLFAAVTGPGSFTGLRVGLSALKGLAQAAARPVLGINALDLTAMSAGTTGEFTVLLEAGRKEVYVGKRQIDASRMVHRLGTDSVITLAALPELLSRETVTFLGSGTAKLPPNEAWRVLTVETPLAQTLALCAEDTLQQGTPPELHPYYIRPSDAEIKFAAN